MLVLKVPPAGRFFFNIEVLLHLEMGGWRSECGGCLRYRSVVLSKAMSLVVSVDGGTVAVVMLVVMVVGVIVVTVRSKAGGELVMW